MTEAEILAMKPGPQMDEAIGKLIGSTPRIKYFAMNKEETAYYLDFNSRKFADDWHNDQVKRFPNGMYVSDGGHIVRKEIYRRYSEDIDAAWTVRKHIHETIGGTQIISICDDLPELCKIWNGKKYIEARGETVPHAIGLAILLAMENKNCS